MTKDLGQLVQKAKEGNLEIKKPYAKQQAFDKAMKGINKWINIQKDWAFILLGLAIIGIIAFVCNLFLCKYVKRVRKNRYDVPVPVCFKEFSATYYHICSNIYGIKSFILNNPILYVFLCVK